MHIDRVSFKLKHTKQRFDCKQRPSKVHASSQPTLKPYLFGHVFVKFSVPTITTAQQELLLHLPINCRIKPFFLLNSFIEEMPLTAWTCFHLKSWFLCFLCMSLYRNTEVLRIKKALHKYCWIKTKSLALLKKECMTRKFMRNLVNEYVVNNSQLLPH